MRRRWYRYRGRCVIVECKVLIWKGPRCFPWCHCPSSPMVVIAVVVVVVALVVGGSSQRPDRSMCCVSVSDKKSGKGTVSRVCFLCVLGGRGGWGGEGAKERGHTCVL